MLFKVLNNTLEAGVIPINEVNYLLLKENFVKIIIMVKYS